MSLVCFAPAAGAAKFSSRPFVVRLCRRATVLALVFTGSQLVAQNASTTTVLQPYPSAGSYTLYAVVSSNNTTAGTLSGQVNFTDQTTGALLGTATLGTANNSTGSFSVSASNALPVTDTCTQPISQVLASDADGDGKLDLVMSNTVTCTSASSSALTNILVARGNGDGTFGAPTTIPVPLPSAAAISNGGTGPIATGNFGSHTELPGYIFLVGNQIYTLPDIHSAFNAPVAISGGTGGVYVSPDSSWVAIGTLSGLNIYSNNAGALTLVNTFAVSGGVKVITGTKYGLAVGNCVYNFGSLTPYTTNVKLFTGATTASLQPGASYSTSTGCITGIVAGGFRGSTYNDILFITNPYTSTTNTSQVMALDDDGAGNYTLVSNELLSISNAVAGQGTLIAADINNDGKLDIATLTNVDGSVLESEAAVYYGNGSGGFQGGSGSIYPFLSPSAQAPAANNPSSLAFGDFTPGVPGIATTSNTGSSYAVSQMGSAYVSATTFYSSPTIQARITGGPDQVVATYVGNGTYASSTSPALPLDALPVATTLRLIPSATTIVAGQTLTVTTLLSPYSIPGATTDSTMISFSGLTPGGVAQLFSGRGEGLFEPAAGTYTITGSFPAKNGVFAASTSAPVTINVLAAAPTLTATALTLAANPAAPTPGQTTTLTATLAPSSISAGNTDGELVTFTNGNIPIGTAKLTSGVATLTTGSLSAGTDMFSAVYPGDVYFAAANASAAVTVAVPPVTINVTPTSSSLTISGPGGSASTMLTFGSSGGFTGTVALTCAVTYTGTGTATAPPSCSFNPTSLTLSSGGTATSTLTITTTASTSASNNLRRSTVVLAGTFAGGLLFLLVPCRRKTRLQLVCLLLVGTLGGLAGCSGGTATTTTGGNSVSTTPGSYNITITATSGSVTKTTTLSVAVQ